MREFEHLNVVRQFNVAPALLNIIGSVASTEKLKENVSFSSLFMCINYYLLSILKICVFDF
jgi:hypothetical protein